MHKRYHAGSLPVLKQKAGIMQQPSEQSTSRFDELMAAQRKLCDIQQASLCGDIPVSPADIDDARRHYTRQLRLNIWEISESNTDNPTETFDKVSQFLTQRMTEIVGSVTEVFLCDEACETELGIYTEDCRSEFEKLINGRNRLPHGDTEAVTVVVNDAVDIAVPLALGAAQSRVRQLSETGSMAGSGFSRIA